MGDDTEFFRRIDKKGNKILYCGNCIVYHKVEKERATLKYIAKWNFNYGVYRGIAGNKSEPTNMVYFLGVPRYIFKKTLLDLFGIFLILFNKKREALACFCKYNIDIGMINGFRQRSRENKNGDTEVKQF